MHGAWRWWPNINPVLTDRSHHAGSCCSALEFACASRTAARARHPPRHLAVRTQTQLQAAEPALSHLSLLFFLPHSGSSCFRSAAETERVDGRAVRRSLNATGRYVRQPTKDEKSQQLMEEHGVLWAVCSCGSGTRCGQHSSRSRGTTHTGTEC